MAKIYELNLMSNSSSLNPPIVLRNLMKMISLSLGYMHIKFVNLGLSPKSVCCFLDHAILFTSKVFLFTMYNES